jgi:hypothetical protein
MEYLPSLPAEATCRAPVERFVRVIVPRAGRGKSGPPAATHPSVLSVPVTVPLGVLVVVVVLAVELVVVPAECPREVVQDAATITTTTNPTHRRSFTRAILPRISPAAVALPPSSSTLSPVRSVAIVVAVVLVIIGVGVAVVGGDEPHGVPRGWVPVYDGYAQLSVPPNWNVVYSPQSCELPENPGVIYITTALSNGPFGCPAMPAGTNPNAPNVGMFPYVSTDLTGTTRTTLDGFPVWTYESPGVPLDVYVPELGVTILASGNGFEEVLNTLTTAPA